MRGIRIRGRLCLAWLLALAVILYTGANFAKEAEKRRMESAEVFAGGAQSARPNVSVMDLLG